MAERTRARTAAATLVAVGALSLVDSLVDHGRVESGPVPVLAAAALALVVGAWCRPLLVVGSGVACAMLLTAANQVHAPGSYSAPNDLTFFGIVLAGPLLLGALWANRTRRLRELRRLSTVRLAQRDLDVQLARAEEQNRLADAVNDSLVQELGGIVLRAAGARRASDTDVRRQALAAVDASARAALDELRTHVGLLRDPAPRATPDLETVVRPGSGSPAALTWLDLAAVGCAVPLAIESVTGEASRGPAVLNVLAAVAVCVPLAWRRRHPLPVVLAVMFAAVVMSAFLTPLALTVSVLGPFVILAYTVGAHTGSRRDLLLGSLALAGGTFAVGVAGPGGGVGSDGLLPTAVWATLAVVGGRVARAREGHLARVSVLLADIEVGREAAISLAVAERRQELARDLHDSVAHAMTVVCLHAGAGLRHGREAAGPVAAALEVIEQTARQGLAELRSGLEALESAPPAPADLGEVVDAARRTGMRVDLSGAGQLDGQASPVAAYVVREALVNASRHAPGAQVSVDVTVTGDALVVTIANATGPEQGHSGSAILGTGHGLTLLGERVTAVQGRLEHGALAGGGYRVTALLPRAGARLGAPS